MKTATLRSITTLHGRGSGVSDNGYLEANDRTLASPIERTQMLRWNPMRFSPAEALGTVADAEKRNGTRPGQ